MSISEQVASFPATDQAFILGVEYGRFYSAVERKEPHINNGGYPIHSANVEVIRDTCIVFGYIPQFVPYIENDLPHPDWTNFQAIKIQSGNN